MSLFICLLAALLPFSQAYQSCTWTYYPDTSIAGGESANAGSLAECQAICAARGTGSCQGLDYSPNGNGCWLLNTKDGKRSSPGIQHYDYDCVDVDPCAQSPCHNGGVCSPAGQSYQCACATGYKGVNCDELSVRDIVASAGNPRCFKTNYPGSPTDFFASNGVTWNFQVATFGFDWPAGFPFGPFVYIDRIQFSSSDNLAYFRVVFKRSNGDVITTDPIGPNKYEYDVRDFNNAKRVDFYLVPVDYKRNVSLTDVKIKSCIKDPIFGLLGTCVFFDIFKFAVSLVTLGIFSPGASGGFSVSTAPVFPYIELDLACTGAGIVEFAQVSFDRTSNFDTVLINIWNGNYPSLVVRSDGVASNSFNYAQGIYFAPGIRGNRLRATIIPSGVPSGATSGSIYFTKYSIYAN